MDGLRVERSESGVAVLTPDRPAKLNSLDEPSLALLTETLQQIAGDDTVRVVVLTGSGRGFCAGADLLAAPPPFDYDGATEWMRKVQSGLLPLFRLPQPIIAVVNGPAAGGGVGLALACDVRIAAPTCSFSVPFIRMGLGPDFGTSKTLPQIVGHAAAMRMLLTGRIVDAEEALAIGLVTQVSTDALGEGLALAEQIAAMPAEATRRIKAQVRVSATTDIETVIDQIEPRCQAEGVSDPLFAERGMEWMQSKGIKAARSA